MENNSLSLQWNQACQTYIHNESYARGSTVTLTMVVNKTLLDPIFSQESMMNFTMAVDMDFSSVQEISPGMPPRGDSVPNNGVDLQFVQVQVVFLLAFLMEVTDVIGKDDSHDALNHDSNHEILQVSQNEMLSYLQMPTTLLYCRYSDSRQEIKMNLLAVKAVLADVQVSDDVHLPHITASSIHISRCALQVLSSTQGFPRDQATSQSVAVDRRTQLVLRILSSGLAAQSVQCLNWNVFLTVTLRIFSEGYET
ncbi:hypothetical protein MJG53_019435 [Ovis ammon polii x Ovis aries]|uniref:Uncharacterized protein n=1 Tax=Ovis ammon polii x Ovis aries TaxID=2918886 RepID=A0ACB9TZE3_9CETA|nr:hypothetical protein MJG53_019435 [Ovis ammon polii x Ovis aries]